MTLKTCSISMLNLSKLDNADINTILLKNGFDIRYKYFTTTTPEGIEFEQWLDKGSRLSLQNNNVDFQALTHHAVNNMGVEG